MRTGENASPGPIWPPPGQSLMVDPLDGRVRTGDIQHRPGAQCLGVDLGTGRLRLDPDTMTVDQRRQRGLELDVRHVDRDCRRDRWRRPR